MQTQLMQPGKSDMPCFERTVSGEVERIPIQSVPFSIGRIESADLQVDSGNVSREHAVVVREGKSYRLRDLGSTNGTSVNGVQIDETELQHGDLVVIADQEFTFVGPGANVTTRLATQVMAGAPKPNDRFERVLAVRRLQESLLHRGFRPQFRTIAQLSDGRVWGQACAALDTEEDTSNWLASPFASSTWHACQLHRTLAMQAFLETHQQESLVVGISAEEADGNELLASQLAQLRSQVGEDALVVNLPAVVYEVERHPLLVALQQMGCATAAHGFVGSHTQIARLKDFGPNYLFLAPAMSRDLHGPRQRRQLVAIIDACAAIDCRPIVCELESSSDEDACRELGFELSMSSSHAGSGSLVSSQLVALVGQ